ncbi:MAG: hypothetical protein K2P81_00590 [Bacteriovoracaceae bacterium]|nr:hypothetical protein [Bacteriovoracaceae bacterium]
MTTIELDSSDIPQANNLLKVLDTLQAVYKGSRSDKDIAQYIGYTPRQARYYRRAVEIFGFITTLNNQSSLTVVGMDFISAMHSNPNHLELLKPYIIQIPIIREVLEYFEDKENVTKEQFLEAMISISGLDPNETTAPRRLSTFISWLDQVGLLTKRDKKQSGKAEETYQVVPYVPVRSKPSKKIMSLYDSFIEGILPYLTSDEESMVISPILSQSIIDIVKVETPDELKKFILVSEENEKSARLILAISEKEEIDFEQLLNEIQDLQKQELTPERVLLERFRSLKSAATSASIGGGGLERTIETWFKNHNVDYETHYLFEGLSKNCDFFSKSIGLVIEAKYSKTSGTKHAGAIKDLSEISKVKANHPDYLVGIAIAGQGFIEDKSTWASIKSLYDEKKIDFVLTPQDLKNLSPSGVKRFKFPKEVNPNDLRLDLDEKTSTWSIPENEDELGLIDATNWLNRYSRVSYMSFESLLQTWISQTPFAIQCLRLILNWSESRMEGYIKFAIPDSISRWKSELTDFDSISILVKGLAQHLNPTERDSVKNFFQTSLSLSDLVISRELGLSGWAKKKKEASSLFIAQCIAKTSFEIKEDTVSLNLASGLKIKSNFSFVDSLGKLNHVLCKYYSTSGSVMSDLVKTIEALCETNHKDEWILIADGPGWLSRDKDLRRLLTLAQAQQFRVMTLHMWESQQEIRSLKKRIL